jgi:hypothetical protein
MGRKKRKIAVKGEDDDDPVDAAVMDEETVMKDEEIPFVKITKVRFEENSEDDEEDTDLHKNPETETEEEGKTATTEEAKKPAISSGYATTTHSGEIVQEDTYVSDGSESEDEHDEEMEIVLIGSRMGIMRRGLLQTGMMVQPNRQWTRTDPAVSEETTQEQRKLQEEEELAKLDPAERAARLLQEKQRKVEEAKELARRSEAEENAGRDSMLFSKRTAFDIRFDQIEDKPWLRGDVSDYFNYGMTEEDWLEYSQQQLLIRQELIDARRQKRLPDPNLVPVTPRETVRWPITPIRETAVKTEDNPGADDEITQIETTIEPEPSMGPERPEQVAQSSAGPTPPQPDIPVGTGGAWGAGAAPGSILAKLIDEQERQLEDPDGANEAEYYPNDYPNEDRPPYAAAQPEEWADDGYNNADSNSHYGDGGYGESSRAPSGGRESSTWNRGPPPPPPPSDHYYSSRSQQSYAPPPAHHHEAPSRHHHEAPPHHHHEAPSHHHHEAPSHHSGGYRGRGGGRGRGGYDRYGGGGRSGGRGPGRGGGADSGRGGGEDYYGSRKRSWEGDRDSRRPPRR